MVDFPIFEEIKTFIYVNIEYILLIIAPLASLILYLANKINQRIETEQAESVEVRKEIINRQTELDKKINGLEDRFDKFELDMRLHIQALQLSYQTGSDPSGRARRSYNKYTRGKKIEEDKEQNEE